ncbi:gp53-like domain-containing protein [Paraburkholderia bryophila]|uniref:Putative tail fiber protein gp53-like C-terminal domain-containing protein n=1 Tax=Paraburkholderia bryophila TaxID=420952 RepID=A0A329CXC6_9BURK|nr:hypothetical protein [Paraburkholderia bryophila]RAS38311.1 hypothetical protein BX591_102607 [Paraburkholderia bryophila]
MKKFILAALWAWAPLMALAQTGTNPTVPTNAALQALSTVTTSTVTRLGFNTAGDVPALTYLASSSACSLNSGAGDNGSQVKSANGLCWIANFPAGPLDVREWGVVANGATTDNTSALQAAWTYGGTVNNDILLPPSDSTNYVKFSQLTAPVGNAGTPASGQGPLSAIRGRGVGQTVLESTVTGSNCAITFNAPTTTYTNAASNRALSDFQLISSASSGTGICLNQITGMELANFNVQQFAMGLVANDAIKIRLDNPQFLGNATAINAGTTGVSNPNQWVIINPYVNSQSATSFLFKNGADIDIYGGDFEDNNTTNSSGNATIEMYGNPLQGRKGLSVFGGYYELNGGSADFLFVQLASDGSGSHSINGVEQARISNTTFVKSAIELVNNYGGSGQTNIDVRGSAFWSSSPYTPNASTPYIKISAPSTANYHITGYDSNYFQKNVEAPEICPINTACMNLPDGHIEEWGQVTSGSTGTGFPVAVTWPLACPNAVDSVATFAVNAGGPYTTGVGVETTTGTTLYAGAAGVAIGWRMLCH